MEQTVAVRLVAAESVVAGGTRKSTWLVYLEGRWVSAKDVPEVELELLDPGAGTIWQTIATLQLPVSCWVQNVQSSPQRNDRRDPLRYLQQEIRGARRRVTRTYYRVNRHGELKRAERGDGPP